MRVCVCVMCLLGSDVICGACVCVCVCVRGRTCMRACVRACVCVCDQDREGNRVFPSRVLVVVSINGSVSLH